MTAHMLIVYSEVSSKCYPAERGKVRMQTSCRLRAARILPLAGLPRSWQDPISRGRGAQYKYLLGLGCEHSS